MATKLTSAQRRWLTSELQDWEARQIVSPAQVAQILACYESADTQHQRTRKTMIFALMSMAAFLLGLAALLVISFNWDALSREAKLATFLIGVTATHALALFLRFNYKLRILSEVVCFLGCLLYGAGIWLVAQAYHIDAHYPDGFWWWAVGVLPFALLLDSHLMHLLLGVLLAFWFNSELDALHTAWFEGEWFPRTLSLPLLLLPGFLSCYRNLSRLRICIYLPLIPWWLCLMSVTLGTPHSGFLWLCGIGAIYLVAAEVHGASHPFAIPYRLWGAYFVTLPLCFLSSFRFWQRAGSITPDTNLLPFVPQVVASLLILLLLATLGITVYLLRRDAITRQALVQRFSRLWFPLSLTAMTGMLTFWEITAHTDPMLPLLLCNLAMIGMAIYLVWVGVREERILPFAGGVVYFLLWASIRYFDLFNELGMLGGAGIFALAAVALFMIALFWSRLRAAHLTRADLPGPPPPSVGLPWLSPLLKRLPPALPSLLITATALQVCILGGMIVVESLPLYFGERVQLRVQPIDPRDPFRGDYVILGYEFSQRSLRPGDRIHSSLKSIPTTYAGPIYVPLTPADDGIHYHPGPLTTTPPQQPPFLRGQFEHGILKFGIEAFYVREGTGKRLEELRNARKLSAEVAILPGGKAKLVRLIETP